MTLLNDQPSLCEVGFGGRGTALLFYGSGTAEVTILTLCYRKFAIPQIPRYYPIVHASKYKDIRTKTGQNCAYCC